jgi:nitrate/TMAO reductase-like tetraheme cytochrome c subunit
MVNHRDVIVGFQVPLHANRYHPSREDHSMILHQPPLALFAFVCAGFAAIILIVYLVRRPPLVGVTKVWLFLGLGVFPIGVAAAGNYQGFEATKERKFCGSCHVMIPHASDSNDLQSGSLASRHARNKLFGDTNCYVCHADYGMYGTIVTKMGGMRHVWLYVTEFRNMSLAEAKKTIHLRKPFPNQNCMQCHSTQLTVWQRVPDHRSSLEDLRSERISCASSGCHGFAHPSTKSEAATPNATSLPTPPQGASP